MASTKSFRHAPCASVSVACHSVIDQQQQQQHNRKHQKTDSRLAYNCHTISLVRNGFCDIAHEHTAPRAHLACVCTRHEQHISRHKSQCCGISSAAAAFTIAVVVSRGAFDSISRFAAGRRAAQAIRRCAMHNSSAAATGDNSISTVDALHLASLSFAHSSSRAAYYSTSSQRKSRQHRTDHCAEQLSVCVRGCRPVTRDAIIQHERRQQQRNKLHDAARTRVVHTSLCIQSSLHAICHSSRCQ